MPCFALTNINASWLQSMTSHLTLRARTGYLREDEAECTRCMGATFKSALDLRYIKEPTNLEGR